MSISVRGTINGRLHGLEPHAELRPHGLPILQYERIRPVLTLPLPLLPRTGVMGKGSQRAGGELQLCRAGGELQLCRAGG